jgi:hypothetical protein
MKVEKYILGVLCSGTLAFILLSCTAAYVTAIPNRQGEMRPSSPYMDGVWIDGDWNYRDKVYYAGYWEKPKSGSAYKAGKWTPYRKGYQWRPGHWE